MKWIGSVIRQAVSNALVTFLAGVFLAILALVFSARGVAFLGGTVLVPVAPLLILIALSLVGIAVACDRVLALVRSRAASRAGAPALDNRLETTSQTLLASMVRVEVGLDNNVEYEVDRFAATLLSQFDSWESAVSRYLRGGEIDQIADIRSQIAGHYLPNASDVAKELIPKIKALTNKARSLVSAPDIPHAA